MKRSCYPVRFVSQHFDLKEKADYFVERLKYFTSSAVSVKRAFSQRTETFGGSTLEAEHAVNVTLRLER